ncbi:MAG: TolC family protein [marine benthic group bacterium]|nr:TolC family protein [Gemmatimonadota bacterium]
MSRAPRRSPSGLEVLALIVLSAAPVAAQETPPEPAGEGLIDIEQARLPIPDRVFDIDRAVQIGIRNNRTLQVSRLDLATAEKQVKEAYGGLVPEIDGSMGYTRNIEVPTSFLPGFIFDPSLPPDSLIPVKFGSENQWSAGLTVSQPLFDAALFTGVSTTGKFRSYQQEVLRGSAQLIATNVRIAYLNVLVAREAHRVTLNSVERVQGTLEETAALNRAGLASDYDVLRLEVQLANITPQLRRTANAVRAAERTLAIEMGLPRLEQAGAAGSLADMDLDSLAANDATNRMILEFTGTGELTEADADSLSEVARLYRSDLRQLELFRELEEARVKVERAELFPTLSAFFNWNLFAQEDDALNFFGEGPNQRFTTSAAGVQLSIPIFSGLRRWTRVQQRQIEVRKVEERLADLNQRVESDVRTTHDQVLEARARARAQRTAVTQAQRGFDIVTREYLAGTKTRLEVTEAEVSLRESELNYAEAVYDYLVARAQLDYVVGAVPAVEPVVEQMIEDPDVAPPAYRSEASMESGK